MYCMLSTTSPLPPSKRKRTFGQKSADTLTRWAGSWTFILILSFLLLCWITANVLLLIYRWDPYPFILLNLVLSFMAAYQAPIILMSQNRAADWDRAKAAQDLAVDRKAESEIRDIQEDLEEIKATLRRMENK